MQYYIKILYKSHALVQIQHDSRLMNIKNEYLNTFKVLHTTDSTQQNMFRHSVPNWSF
jgi:hypothetical protein